MNQDPNPSAPIAPATRGARMALTLAALAAAVTLAACGAQDDNQTAGQALDEAVATTRAETEAAADRLAQEARSARNDLGQAVADARITAELNAALARDAELSALGIDVDTDGGHVLLDGRAPSTAARDRAELLARGIDGVLSVDNRLTVGAG